MHKYADRVKILKDLRCGMDKMLNDASDQQSRGL